MPEQITEKPKETKQEDRPTLNFISPLDGEEHAIGFGYLSGVPYAALFKGELLTAMIPREVLEIAIAQGWE